MKRIADIKIKSYIYTMISIQETEEMIAELADEMPEAFFKELNGGIMLLPKAKKSQVEGANGLYVMGEYHRNNNLGRYIVIYYGSFTRVHGDLNREDLKTQLRKTLRHEFRHHVESLSGERGLEHEDAKFINDYLRQNNNRGLAK